jgi:Gram-negative bacterial TonB protein C-terminal
MKNLFLNGLLLALPLAYACNSAQLEGTEYASALDQVVSTDPTTMSQQLDKSAFEEILSEDLRIDSTQTLQTLFEEKQATRQSYSIQLNKDTTIFGEEGTAVTIPEGAFIDPETGLPPTGQVKITMQEYYSISDLVLSGLTTQSNAGPLESAGTINLEASCNGKKLILAPNKKALINFPVEDFKPNMDLYYGYPLDGELVWSNNPEWIRQYSGNVTVDTNTMTFTPRFVGGKERLDEYIKQNQKYPYSALTKGIEGDIWVGFVVNDFGYICQPSIVRGLEPSLDKAALELVRKMPQWIPGAVNGVYSPMPACLVLKYEIDSTLITKEYKRDALKYESAINNKVCSHANQFELRAAQQVYYTTPGVTVDFTAEDLVTNNTYAFSTPRFGMINCDRPFVPQATSKETIVYVGEKNNVTTRLIHKKRKVIVPITPDNEGNAKLDLLMNEDYALISIKCERGKYYIAKLESLDTSASNVRMKYEKVSKDDITKEIREMDKFWM